MTELEGKLAEYQTLRQEILQNDKMIQVMNLVAFFFITLPLGAFAFKEHSELLLIPPMAFFLYFQMVTHKLEGTIRIASYISAFLEPSIPGLAWESRLAQIRGKIGGLPGMASHVVLMLIATVGTIIPSITASSGPHAYASGGVAGVVLIFSLVQLTALKNLAGPDGFAKVWAGVKE